MLSTPFDLSLAFDGMRYLPSLHMSAFISIVPWCMLTPLAFLKAFPENFAPDSVTMSFRPVKLAFMPRLATASMIT